MPSFRGFIAIDIDPTERIREFSEDLRRANAKLKMVEPKNLHVTLKFLGETREDIVDEIVDYLVKNGKIISGEENGI